MTITYNSNGATWGTAPVDSTAYTAGQSAIVLGNTGFMIRSLYIFIGWNTSASGTGNFFKPGDTIYVNSNITLYGVWVVFNTVGTWSIRRGRRDPSVYSDAQIQAAATLNAFIEHNTIGDDMMDGLAALQLENQRYTTGIKKWVNAPSGAINPGWFDDNQGIISSYRDNVQASIKMTNFAAAVASLSADIKIAMLKFHYSDGPAAGDAYDTGVSLYSAYINFMQGLEAQYPDITFIYCTMPIETTEHVERAKFINLVRQYCYDNNKWLFDIADMENTIGEGGFSTAGSSQILSADFKLNASGGEINTTAGLMLARAYWTLLGAIVAELQSTTYGVTYIGNGSDGGTEPVDSTNYVYGNTALVSANTGNLRRTGYFLTGWNTAADGSGVSYAFGSSIFIKADVTLYAQWEFIKYSVTFNTNGGTGNMNQLFVGESGIASLPVNTFTRSGYAFIGWNTASDGSRVSYADGASISISADMTLYAQWRSPIWTAVPVFEKINVFGVMLARSDAATKGATIRFQTVLKGDSSSLESVSFKYKKPDESSVTVPASVDAHGNYFADVSMSNVGAWTGFFEAKYTGERYVKSDPVTITAKEEFTK